MCWWHSTRTESSFDTKFPFQKEKKRFQNDDEKPSDGWNENEIFSNKNTKEFH
jgi:hypothetical protein